MAKDPYVVANWKMYKTAREATDYLESLYPLVEGMAVNLFFAVPFTSIAPCVAFAKEMSLVIGAQNMSDAKEGAFTGEIASLMLKEAGAEFVILGHSERRQIFREDLEMIRKKVLRALQDDLTVILCVGETLDEHEASQRDAVLEEQIRSALEEVPEDMTKKLLLAYEPVWAIGTGKTATPKLAEEAHAVCREVLAGIFGKRKASSLPILYGGSVKPDNTEALLKEKNIDGVLVGGASLNFKTLFEIAENAVKKGKKK